MAPARGDPLLGRVTAAVRSDDRICPVLRGTVVVELGTEPREVTPFELAERLARASSQPPSPAGLGEESVAVGLAVGSDADDPRRLSRAALGAHRSSRSQLEGARAAGTSNVLAVLTIDAARDDSPKGIDATRQLLPRRRRSAYRFSAGRLSWGSPRPPQFRAEAPPGGGGESKTLVVVDPCPVTPRVAGLATATAASVAEGIGFRSLALAREDQEPLPLVLDGAPVDVAVVVLDGSRASEFFTRPAWQVPEEITRWYRSAGATVLALSAGAGAATLASCTAEGAVPVFDMELLPGLLRRIASADGAIDQSATAAGSPGPGLSLPPRFQALVDLTPSERRVLFYMTGGWAAQEIAEDLVVSLTTVRSHIRSILRKLGVRSQLAAVAIANSREPFEASEAARDGRLEGGNGRPRPFPRTNDPVRSA